MKHQTKSILLVRFTFTFKSFIIPLKVSNNEILLCYTEGTAYISPVYVRESCHAIAQNKYSFLGSLRSVRQIRGVNNALDVA